MDDKSLLRFHFFSSVNKNFALISRKMFSLNLFHHWSSYIYRFFCLRKTLLLCFFIRRVHKYSTLSNIISSFRKAVIMKVTEESFAKDMTMTPAASVFQKFVRAAFLETHRVPLLLFLFSFSVVFDCPAWSISPLINPFCLLLRSSFPFSSFLRHRKRWYFISRRIRGFAINYQDSCRPCSLFQFPAEVNFLFFRIVIMLIENFSSYTYSFIQLIHSSICPNSKFSDSSKFYIFKY